MRNIRILLALSILLTSSSAFCISENSYSFAGYELEPGSNVVVGHGKEWLRFTYKDDYISWLTVEETIAHYALDGWKVASNSDMSNLLNNFNLGVVVDADENTQQHYSQTWIPENNNINRFMNLFGKSDSNTTFYEGEVLQDSELNTYFGADEDGDGFYNRLNMFDGLFTFSSPNEPPTGALSTVTVTSDVISKNRTIDNIAGFAFVRDKRKSDVPEINASGAPLALLLLLCVLGMIREKKKT